MFGWLARVASVVAFVVSGMAALPAQADNTKKTLESLTKMVKEAGFKSTIDEKSSGHILIFEGKGGRKFGVAIIAVDDVLSIQSRIATAEQITRPKGIEAELLMANNEYSFMKLLFDAKGNLNLRYDIYENMVDADDLKKLVKMFVENNDNFYNAAPWIKK
jgi:hypothetical protein